MKVYRFYKEDSNWYIDLPEYLAQGGSLGDLKMVEGADWMLELMAEGKVEVELAFSETQFDNSDELSLIEKCDPYIGGGYYLINEYEGQILDKQIWLCRVTEFVFGHIPEKIFVKRRQH